MRILPDFYFCTQESTRASDIKEKFILSKLM